MPFYKNYDQQVRLRFSRYTAEVIQYDMFHFGVEKENTFINTVIRNFYETANSSINIRLNTLQYSLEESLSTKMNKSSANVFIKTMIEIEEKRLIELINSYDSPDKYSKSKPYRLQNDIYDEFTDPDSDFQENKYYNESCPAYLKTLIEEYAHLPYFERERIYFKPYFDTIEEAIAQKKQLLITTSNDMCYHTLPYKILSDPLSTVHYLTGYSYPLLGEKSEKYTASYKISTIKKLRIEKSKSAYLHPDDISTLVTAISEKGVQFLVSEYIEIIVRFTEDGMNSFHRWAHLRPEPISITKEKDSYIAVFKCSLNQASAYFFKFGEKIEILSPIELRNQFIEQYKDALSNYMN